MAALSIALLASDDEAGTVNTRTITLAVLSAEWFMPPEGDAPVYLGGIKRNRRPRRWTAVVIFDVFGVTGTGGTVTQDRGHLQLLQASFLNAEHLFIIKTGTVLASVGRMAGVTDPFNYWTDDTNGILSDTPGLTKKVVAIYSPPSRDMEHAVDNFTVTFEEAKLTYA